MSRYSFLAICGLTLLTACGTPQEQCISRETYELRNLQYLLKEVDGNLARGYAWEEYERPYWRREACGTQTVLDKNGNPVERVKYCMRHDTEIERRMKPIDPAEEKRKRDGLVAKIKALTPQVDARIAACKVSYPE